MHHHESRAGKASRAFRRHQRERWIRRNIAIFGRRFYPGPESFHPTERLSDDTRRFAGHPNWDSVHRHRRETALRHLATRSPCSCAGCGNPRRHFKGKDRATLQERRAGLAAREDARWLQESGFGTEPRSDRTIKR